MLKQNTRILNVAKVFFDLALVCVAFFMSWALKFTLNIIPDVKHLPLGEYLKLLFLGLPIFVLLQYLTGLYKPQRTLSVSKEIRHLAVNSSLLFVAVLLYLFIFKIYHISRIFTGLYCAFTFILTVLGRMLQRFVLRLMRKKGYNKKYVVLLGFTDKGKAYLDAILTHKETGYTPIGILEENVITYKDVAYLGRAESLESVLEIHTVDEVVIDLPLEKYSALPEILEVCENCGVKSVIIPAYTDYIPAKPQMDEIENIPLINTRYIPLDNVLFAAIKYGFDFVVSLILSVILSPVLILCAILVKCSSKGPVFYTQERIGYNKKPFKIYKFRTMFSDSPDGWTVKDDPRVTPVGKFLRKSSLDELPQLFNVLKGEMSLVGPRPEQTVFVEQFKTEIPKYMLKHRVRPGITGLAQVRGLRGDTSIKERIRSDIEYIENWSPLLDLKIMILTLFNRGGY